MTQPYGLKELVADSGGSLDEVIRHATFDSMCPGICPECGYTTEVETDQRKGWCEECEKGTVVSAMILAGVI